ncbi:MAG: sulfatase family protein, partial [Planctomycetota bacterium]
MRIACLFTLILSVALQAAERPNVVVILADDMGVGDVAALNSEAKVTTPHIDRLADEGVIFRDGHTCSAVCTPTRYGLLTGRYNWRSPLKKHVVDGYAGAVISPTLDTMAAMLQRAGYATACIGKWHLGLSWQRADGTVISELKVAKGVKIESEVDFSKPFVGGPTTVGFDYFYGISASLDFPPYVMLENDRVTEVPAVNRPGQGGKRIGEPQLMMRGGLAREGFRPEMVLSEFTAKAVEWIGQQSGEQPFFLYMPINSPHTPVVPREEFLGSSKCGIYGDFIQETDWAVGQVLAALEAKGVLDNTLVVFTADNGASKASFSLEQEEEFGHKPSHIYAGRKGSLNEGGHRVPLVARWGAVTPAGMISDGLVCLNDLYATAAELAGVDGIDPAAGVDSHSFATLLRDPSAASARANLVSHDFGGRFAFRSGPWKVIL